MSVMGFQKISLDGVGGWCELYPIFWDFLNLFNFAKPLAQSKMSVGLQTG